MEFYHDVVDFQFALLMCSGLSCQWCSPTRQLVTSLCVASSSRLCLKMLLFTEVTSLFCSFASFTLQSSPTCISACQL